MYYDEYNFYSLKMNNNERHRIKTQIQHFKTNEKICKISLFYKYVRRHICRLVILNGLTEISELWDFSYTYFNNLVIDYVRMLGNCDCANSQFKQYKIIFRDNNYNKQFLMYGSRLGQILIN